MRWIFGTTKYESMDIDDSEKQIAVLRNMISFGHKLQ